MTEYHGHCPCPLPLPPPPTPNSFLSLREGLAGEKKKEVEGGKEGGGGGAMGRTVRRLRGREGGERE